MEKIKEISNYVDEMRIKKVLFGGYDKTDVEMKMGELLVIFEKCMTEEKEAYNAKLAECESKLQTSQMMFNEMNKKLCKLMEEQCEMEKEKEKLKGAYKEYCASILQQYSESLRTLSSEFTQILENITSLQQNMIETDIFDEMVMGLEGKKTEYIEVNE